MHEFRIENGVAVLAFDDGKANAVGYDFIEHMEQGLDKAASDATAVVIAGREGLFSGGFDLAELRKGAEAANALVDRGARMLLRLFSHPQPVVAACTGHAVAAGAFILLSCDTRVGADGDFSIGLNETALGMSFPVFAIELTHARLSKRHVTAAFVQSTRYPKNQGCLQWWGNLRLESGRLRIKDRTQTLPAGSRGGYDRTLGHRRRYQNWNWISAQSELIPEAGG